MIRRSRVVIVICPSLEETVRAIEPQRADRADRERAGLGRGAGDAGAGGGRARDASASAPTTPLVLYTGTFEAYQGLDLLFDAMALVRATRPDARLLLAGGKPDQVAARAEQARAAGIDDVTIFAGERPAAEIPAYLLAADVLVSPRSRGTNTPLKIYQYLRSGKPIVATRLLTHTQVLSDETAILTGASPRGVRRRHPGGARPTRRARRPIGRRARELAETKYSYEAYLERTRQACGALAPPAPRRAGAVVKDVA